MGISSLPKYDRREVAVLIPAYNEEKLIKKTIQAAQNIGCVYVADDASTDKTKEIALQTGAVVISAPYNMGKGDVLNYALPQTKEKIVLLIDADLEESCLEGQKLVEAVLEGADLSIGLFRSQGGFGLVRRLASLLLFFKTGHYFQAPLSGQRAAYKETWEKLQPFSSGFALEVAMLKKACFHRLNIVEIPVLMSDRNYGRGLYGIKHRLKQLIAVLKGVYL